MKRTKWYCLEDMVNWILNFTDEMGSCLISRYKANNKSYPVLSYKGRVYYLRNVVLEYKLGRPIRNGFYCRCTCGNKKCVNPEHLEEARRKDLLVEYYNKGDIKIKYRGEDSNFCKHSNEKLKEMIKMYDKGFTRKEIAYLYGCTEYYVGDVVSGNVRPEVFLEALNEIKKENGMDDRQGD